MAGLARVEEGRGGRTRLKITITAEIDSVKGGYAMTFGRYGKDAAVGYAAVGADKGAERFTTLMEALIGKRPRMYRRSGYKIMIACCGEHPGGSCAMQSCIRP
jgi:hypothetical protein